MQRTLRISRLFLVTAFLVVIATPGLISAAPDAGTEVSSTGSGMEGVTTDAGTETSAEEGGIACKDAPFASDEDRLQEWERAQVIGDRSCYDIRDQLTKDAGKIADEKPIENTDGANDKTECSGGVCVDEDGNEYADPDPNYGAATTECSGTVCYDEDGKAIDNPDVQDDGDTFGESQAPVQSETPNPGLTYDKPGERPQVNYGDGTAPIDTSGGSCENTGTCGGDDDPLSKGGIFPDKRGEYVQAACATGQTCTLTPEQKRLIEAHNRAVDQGQVGTEDPEVLKDLEKYYKTDQLDQAENQANKTIPQPESEAVYKHMIRLVHAENCSGARGSTPSKSCLAMAESIRNRAIARDHSYGQVTKWFCDGPGGYYSCVGGNRDRYNNLVEGSEAWNRSKAAVDAALNGSNVCGGCQHNEVNLTGTKLARYEVGQVLHKEGSESYYIKSYEKPVDISQYKSVPTTRIVSASEAQLSGQYTGTVVDPAASAAPTRVASTPSTRTSTGGTAGTVRVTTPLGSHSFTVPRTGNQAFDNTFSSAMTTIFSRGANGSPTSVLSGLSSLVGSAMKNSLSSAGVAPSNLASSLIPKELQSAAPGLSGALSNLTKLFNPLSGNQFSFGSGNLSNLSPEQLSRELLNLNNRHTNELQTLLRQNVTPNQVQSVLERQLRELNNLSQSGNSSQLQRQISGLDGIINSLQRELGGGDAQNIINDVVRQLERELSQLQSPTTQSRTTAANALYNLLRQQGQELDQLGRGTNGTPSFAQLRSQLERQNSQLRQFADQYPAADQSFIQQMIRENDQQINGLLSEEIRDLENEITDIDLQLEIDKLNETIRNLERELRTSGDDTKPNTTAPSNLTATALRADKITNNEYRFRGSLSRTLANKDDHLSFGELSSYFGSTVEHELLIDYQCDGTVDDGIRFSTPYYSILPRADGADVLLSEYVPITEDGLHCFAFAVDVEDAIPETKEDDNTSTWREFIAGFGVSKIPEDELPPLNFEVSVYSNDLSTQLRNWVSTNGTTEVEIEIQPGQQLVFRWNAVGYKRCIPLLSALTPGMADNTDPENRNTLSEQYDLHEHQGYYQLRCEHTDTTKIGTVYVDIDN